MQYSKKVTEHTVCVFNFSTTFFSKTLLKLRGTVRDITKMYVGVHVNYPLFSSDFNETLIFYTYLLTPRCRVLLEKLTGLQLVKKFPAFHGTPRFITTLTSVRHLSLSWASPIQSIYPHPTSWRSIHLRLGLPSGSPSLRFPHQDSIHSPLLNIILAIDQLNAQILVL